MHRLDGPVAQGLAISREKRRIRVDDEIPATIGKTRFSCTQQIRRSGLMVATGTLAGFYGDIPIGIKAQHHIAYGDLSNEQIGQ